MNRSLAHTWCIYIYAHQRPGEGPPVLALRDELRDMADTWTDEQFFEVFSRIDWEPNPEIPGQHWAAQ